jgi:asparagine synthase (glutamine-hydrolysing)
MCGIWAVLGPLAAQPAIRAYLDALKARGPEYAALTTDISGMLLGFTRLAINGLTPAGHQPFTDGGLHTVCNGEIYNYKELAQRHTLNLATGTSDCAVLPPLYKLLTPTELCRTLDGVFATVIVDTTAARVFVARDPYGVRPLFQAQYEDGSIVWSSEVKGVPLGYTSIASFPPGTYRMFDMNATLVEERRYHTIPTVKLAHFTGGYNLKEAQRALRASLIAAVKKRLLSDRPIGALLSGGVDSSLIAAIAARELKYQGKRLTTFSIGMPGSTDLKYAKMVAEHINSIHHEIVVEPKDFLEAIPTVIQAIESYDITSVRASVGNYLVGKYIKEKTDIKVVFNGDGSDEIGGGYIYFYAAPSDEAFETESERLLDEIHLYDVLRSDRCISSHGLEPRTPFLDKNVVATWRAMDTQFRRPRKATLEGRGAQMEKQVLREAFELDNYLPFEVLWRKKEAFSDGVSATHDSWYKRCIEFAQTKGITVDIIQQITMGWHNPPQTEEAYWYRVLFEDSYGADAATLIPRMWMPRWTNASDPSARTLKELYSS